MEPHDYVVGFSDAQTLQGIRRRLFKAIEAVDQALEIITGIKKHCPELRDASTMPTGLEQEFKLEFLFNRFQNHRRNLVALVDFQQGASALVGASRSSIDCNSSRLTDCTVFQNVGSKK